MSHVLTLIAAPAAHGLDNSTLTRVRESLQRAGATTGVTDWLAPGSACDLSLAGLPAAQAREVARAALGDQRPVDIAVVPAARRRKRLLLADMDATIITQESLDELARVAGVADRVVEITERAMAGELDFAGAVRERVALLAGKPTQMLQQTLTQLSLRPGARTLVATMRAHGASTALVSGGFSVFAERIAQLAGFDHYAANVLGVADGKLTGAVQEPIRDGASKAAELDLLSQKQALSADDTMAVGDGANDRLMLAASGLGVAFHAKPILAEEAAVRIDHADLTALLYLQGYRFAEFRDT